MSLTDLREFAAAITFARPGWLWLSLVPLVLGIGSRLAARFTRRRLEVLGRPAAIAGLHTRPGYTNRLGRFLMALGWLLLVIAAAGPRWGTAPGDSVAVGRDIVVAIDLSRSMWADDIGQPRERWQAAVAGVRDLVEALRTRGGHRVAIVLFAARPVTWVPLTADLDHIAEAVSRLDGRVPPAEIRPDETSKSGTRLGVGIAAAVAAHDSRFVGAQDIVLMTDADDPADDREWQTGITVARQAGIPVHVVGVGDPARETFVYRDREPVESLSRNGVREQIRTRLHEDVAQAIAAEGRGQYLASQTKPVPAVGEFWRTSVADAKRELTGDAGPQPQDRALGFLLAALACFALGVWRGR